MTAMKEALALIGLISDSKVTILHRDMRPLGKGSEEFYQSVLNEKRISLVRGQVAKITEAAESRNLRVELSPDGAAGQGGAPASATHGAGATQASPRTEEFDLVVLSVGVRAAGKALSRKTGVRLNKYGFCTTDSLNPGVTSKAGILSAGSFTAPMDIQSSVSHADATAAVALRTLGQSGAHGSAAAGGSAWPPDRSSSSAAAWRASWRRTSWRGWDTASRSSEMGGHRWCASRYEFKLDEKSRDVVTSLLEAARANSRYVS
jgi:heterodisulfide reductase subunit A